MHLHNIHYKLLVKGRMELVSPKGCELKADSPLPFVRLDPNDFSSTIEEQWGTLLGLFLS